MNERTCSVPECRKKAKPGYREAICGMHRERFRLHGSYDNPRVRLDRVLTRTGYWRIYDPAHPLAMCNGCVEEHRAVLFQHLGPTDHPCHWCGKVLGWFHPFPAGLVVDHLDGCRTNNDVSNLVPSCMGCNTARSARARTHCSRGHELTPANTYVQDSDGVRRRRCRTCIRQR